MRKHRVFLAGALAAFFAASILITACNGPNDPKKPQDQSQDIPTPQKPKMLAAGVFPQAPSGTVYWGYKITWTDAQGNSQTKTITADEAKNGFALPGGVKEGTLPRVTPLVKNADGSTTEDTGAAKDVTPSVSTDSKLYIKAGIDELSKEKPDYDAVLELFKGAYGAEQNDTTKAYYSAVLLASISVKPETVSFIRNKIGIKGYPEKFNALVNLDWFKEYTNKYTDPNGITHEDKEYFPELQPAADWYKDMFPALQIPAYIIEHSNSANVDQLIDELYTILFGAEFAKASELLNSLNQNQSVTIDKQLITGLHLSGENGIFDKDSDVKLQKDQLLGLIGSLTVLKGGFEFIQSYSFNTDLSILKWDWFKDSGSEAFKTLGSYKQSQDPFNNGFLRGRNSQKIIDAKKDMVKGADLLLAAYKSLTDSDTLPAKAKEELKKEADPIQTIVKEFRDAIDGGRKANLYVGENNPLKGSFGSHKEDPSNPGDWIYIPTTKFEIDMGKVFTYEYFKLSNLFEMNGSKPKIYPADATHSDPYMKLTLSKFLKDFVTIEVKNGEEWITDATISLHGQPGAKLVNFYK